VEGGILFRPDPGDEFSSMHERGAVSAGREE
jgi:hypothetical protein